MTRLEAALLRYSGRRKARADIREQERTRVWWEAYRAEQAKPSEELPIPLRRRPSFWPEPRTRR